MKKNGKTASQNRVEKQRSLENPIKNPFLPTTQKKRRHTHGFCVYWVIKVEHFMVYSFLPVLYSIVLPSFEVSCK